MIRKLEFKALDSKKKLLAQGFQKPFSIGFSKTFQHRVFKNQIAFKITDEGKLGKNKDYIYFQNIKEQNSTYKIEKLIY